MQPLFDFSNFPWLFEATAECGPLQHEVFWIAQYHFTHSFDCFVSVGTPPKRGVFEEMGFWDDSALSTNETQKST
jgi:hypothetical protein